VTTASGARVTLRFDDGLWAALHENTQFRIEDFRYRPSAPAADRAVFVLLQGVLRIVTGALGHRNPRAFELRAPNMIVGIRGTDFMVAIANSTYLSVLEGTVVATNAGGTASFSAGAFAAATEDARPAAAIGAEALPAPVASAFGNLRARRIAPPASPEPAAPLKRELKGDMGRDHGAATSTEARERSRDIGSKARVK
jgi:hypothetical protein